MKNFLIANFTKGRYKIENTKTLLNAQIDNSLELDWRPRDIILLTNFAYEYRGIIAQQIPLNHNCLTGSKMYGMKYLFDCGLVNDVIWAHDLDAWQNVPFACPDFKDVGIACYSNSKFNGGSVFWRNSARDIADEIIHEIEKNGERKEEPTLNRVLRLPKYQDRVTILNNTFNVGCSGYVKRWEKSIKPIHVCHFHPYNKTAWETHALDRNGLDTTGISDRLENLLRRHYPNLATELSESGKIAQQERKSNRLLSSI